jgi:hypothetical protein
MDNVFSRIAEHFDLDWKQTLVALLGAAITLIVFAAIAYIRFGIWQIQHPNAPWWSWLM